MRQKMVKVLSSVCTLMLIFIPMTITLAAEDTSYSITIVKYKLTESIQLAKPLPVDGTEAKQVTDVNGKNLEPFEKVQYKIVRVTPQAANSDFEVVKGVEAFETIITTDIVGKAFISNLSRGMYQVTELENSSIPKVMEPVVLELPLPQLNGESLDQVFIYPKSSILTDSVPPNPVPPSRIPQTSGSIGTYYGLFALFGLLVLMGVWGVMLISKKQRSL